MHRNTELRFSIISVLEGYTNWAPPPLQRRSDTNCANPLGSKYLLLGNDTVGTTNMNSRASGSKIKLRSLLKEKE